MSSKTAVNKKRNRDEANQDKAPETKKQKKEEVEERSKKQGKGAKKPERNIRIEIYLHKGRDIKFYLPGIIAAVGAPGLGKTHFGRYILFQSAPYFKHGIIFCPNPTSEQEWDCVQAHRILRVYDTRILEKFMEDQETNGFPPAFIFFDDCIGSVKFDDSVIKKLCTQFRKYNILVWFGIQYLADVMPPVIRQCAQFVYSFATLEDRMCEMLWDSWFSPWFKNAQALKMAFMQFPETFYCLYLDCKYKKMNVVHAPSPDELPEFELRWQVKPKDENGTEIKDEAEDDPKMVKDPPTLKRDRETERNIEERARAYMKKSIIPNYYNNARSNTKVKKTAILKKKPNSVTAARKKSKATPKNKAKKQK